MVPSSLFGHPAGQQNWFLSFKSLAHDMPPYWPVDGEVIAGIDPIHAFTQPLTPDVWAASETHSGRFTAEMHHQCD